MNRNESYYDSRWVQVLKQLSIRGFDEELAKRLEEVARSRGISLNKAALFLLRKGAGLQEPSRTNVVGDSLDRFIGSWSAEEETQLLEALAVFEQVDESLWS